MRVQSGTDPRAPAEGLPWLREALPPVSRPARGWPGRRSGGETADTSRDLSVSRGPRLRAAQSRPGGRAVWGAEGSRLRPTRHQPQRKTGHSAHRHPLKPESQRAGEVGAGRREGKAPATLPSRGPGPRVCSSRDAGEARRTRRLGVRGTTGRGPCPPPMRRRLRRPNTPGPARPRRARRRRCCGRVPGCPGDAWKSCASLTHTAGSSLHVHPSGGQRCPAAAHVSRTATSSQGWPGYTQPHAWARESAHEGAPPHPRVCTGSGTRGAGTLF